MRLNFQNFVVLNYQFPKVLLLAKNQYFVIIAFKMLKMEFKFKNTTLLTKLETILASLF